MTIYSLVRFQTLIISQRQVYRVCIQVHHTNHTYIIHFAVFCLSFIFAQGMFDGSQHWLHYLCDPLSGTETLHPPAQGDEDERHSVVIHILRLCHG